MVNILEKHKRAILFLNIMLPFLLGIGIDLYVPSLPAISLYFHAATHLVQWTITSYMLGYGVSQLFWGAASDHFGRRPILLISLSFYFLMTISTLFANSIEIFILARLLQGVALGGIGSVCRAVVTDSFTEKDLISAMSSLSASWAMGPIIGPFIGGYLQHYFNWQANFVFYATYALLLLFYIYFLVPETLRTPSPKSIPHLLHQYRSVLVDSTFIRVTVGLSFMYSILVLFNIVGPFLIQSTLHYSAVIYGYVALMMGFAYFLGNVVNRFLMNFFDGHIIIWRGLFCAILSVIVAIVLSLFFKASLFIIVTPIFFLFMFMGMVFPNQMSEILGKFSHIGGIASSIYGSVAVTIVSLITMIGSSLSTQTQFALLLTYFILLLFVVLLFNVRRVKVLG